MSGATVHPIDLARVSEGMLERAPERPSLTGPSPLAGTVYTAPELPERCAVCQRQPEKVINAVSECSHVDCPHRGRAWVGGTGPAPWRPVRRGSPLDLLFDKVED